MKSWLLRMVESGQEGCPRGALEGGLVREKGREREREGVREAKRQGKKERWTFLLGGIRAIGRNLLLLILMLSHYLVVIAQR